MLLQLEQVYMQININLLKRPSETGHFYANIIWYVLNLQMQLAHIILAETGRLF